MGHFMCVHVLLCLPDLTATVNFSLFKSSTRLTDVECGRRLAAVGGNQLILFEYLLEFSYGLVYKKLHVDP